jgi:hypothetical protein
VFVSRGVAAADRRGGGSNRLVLVLVVVALVACGGKSTPVTPPPTVAPAPLEPSCPPGGITLSPEHRLSCRELPFEVTFPAGTELVRQSDRAMTLYSAKLDKGVMLVIAEPRTDAPDPKRLAMLLETLVKGIAADATITAVAPPTLPGASISTGFTFTTPDGGAGIVHGYFANHWLVAAVTGARLPTAPSRPDKPEAQAFLASLKLKPLPTGTRRHELANGGHITLPATAWPTTALPAQDGVVSEVVHLAPDRGVWIGVRELELRDRCDYHKGAVAGATDDIGERLKTIYSNAQNPLSKIERAKHGDVSVYAEADSPSSTQVVMYLICAGKTVVQLTVAGEKPSSELRPHLDEVAKTLVGAK